MKINVLRRYKHDKYLELNEELRKIDPRRDKKTFLDLNSELRSLNYNSNRDGDNLMELTEIESKVKEIIEELEERETSLLDEDGESSMLCKLNMINLINLLKHFKIQINYSQFNHYLNNNDNEDENIGLNERYEIIERSLKEKVKSVHLISF